MLKIPNILNLNIIFIDSKPYHKEKDSDFKFKEFNTPYHF